MNITAADQKEALWIMRSSVDDLRSSLLFVDREEVLAAALVIGTREHATTKIKLIGQRIRHLHRKGLITA